MSDPGTAPPTGARYPGARTGVPPTVRQVLGLAGYQLRDYFRSRRFILLYGIVIAIGAILTTVVAHFRPANLLGEPAAFLASLWGGGVPLVIVLAGVIFGGDAIAGEFQNKTGYFLMGLPIRRVTVYAGKYIAAFVAALGAIGLFAAIVLGNGAYYFGAGVFTGVFGLSFVLAIVYLLAVLGATFLFSSLFKTSAYAVLLVAILFLFGFTLLQDLVSSLVKMEPWFIISYASPVIGYVFDNPYPAHVNHVQVGPRAFLTLYNPTLVEGVAIMLGYFLLTAIAGLLLFEREEFA